MRRETRAERDAWTAYFAGRQVAENKYHAVRAGQYASRREADHAARLAALERGGKIWDLKEQVSFVLVPGDGKIRPIRYVADFVWHDAEGRHVADTKGGEATKTPLYRCKKKMMKLLLGIDIEEI